MIRYVRDMFYTLLLINLFGVSSRQASDSCNFTNQCIYNLEVNHCSSSSHTVRRSTDCSCADLENVEGNLDRLASVIRQIKDRFHSLSSELTSAVSDLRTKTEQYQNLKNENLKLRQLYERTSSDINATTVELETAREKSTNDIAKIKDALKKTSDAASVCQTTLTAAQQSKANDDKDVSLTFCGFERTSTCGYTQDKDDQLDWSRGSKAVSRTGPRADHTYGAPSADERKDEKRSVLQRPSTDNSMMGTKIPLGSLVLGHYLFIDAYDSARSGSSLKTARITSPEMPPSSGYCLRFWYNMYGTDIKTLKVYAKIGSGLGYPIFTHAGQIDQNWHLAEVNLDSEYTRNHFKIVFEASTNAHQTWHYTSGTVYYDHINTKGNIAIDDIYLYNASCPHVSVSTCPPDWHASHNGSSTTCYSVQANPSTWYDASRACRMEDVHSHLVSIDNSEEQQTLIRIINGNQTLKLIGQNGFYTSGNDEQTEHTFVWTDTGTPYNFGYTDWYQGQPNNVGGNQDCVLLQYPDADFEWGDVACSEKHPFICEINK